MGIRIKILSGFVILALMLLLAGLWSIYEFRTIGSSVQKLLDENYRSINAARMMTEAIEREDSAVLLLMLGRWGEGRAILDSAHTVFMENLTLAKSNVTIPGEAEYVAAVEEAYTKFTAAWKAQTEEKTDITDLALYFSHVHKAFLDLKRAIVSLRTLNNQVMYDTAKGLKERAHRAAMPGIIAIVAAVLFTLLFNYVVNIYFVSPVMRVKKRIESYLDHGRDLDVRMPANDELSEINAEVGRLIRMADSRKG